jgi:hypothetical protein
LENGTTAPGEDVQAPPSNDVFNDTHRIVFLDGYLESFARSVKEDLSSNRSLVSLVRCSQGRECFANCGIGSGQPGLQIASAVCGLGSRTKERLHVGIRRKVRTRYDKLLST